MLKGKILVTTIIVIAGIFSGGILPDATAAEITIGTGSRAGVYYQVGRALCRILRANADEHGLSCQAGPTAGSIFNLKNIRSGALDLGVAQSDWQYHALSGSNRFAEGGPDDSLRALFSVHSEPFTVVARNDSGLETFEDLKGHRVNIGNPGSGQRGTMEVVMEAMGWTKDDFSLANELPASQQSLALCHDRVQAMVYTVGHPNPSVGQATGLCDARILPVTGEAIDKLISANPYYASTQIPGGIYIGNEDPVTTFGVMATVVVSSATDDETAYKIVSAVFENLAAFRKMHPAFGNLEPERMIRDGLSAPLHEGAKRYYQEQGWL